jgi:hypothetical protein
VPQFSTLPQFSPLGLMTPFAGVPGAYGVNGSIGLPPAVMVQPPYATTPHPAQQIVLLLEQLAQQISIQGAVSQHIGHALHHLVQQLLTYQQLAQTQPFIGTGQTLGLTAPFLGAPVSPYFATPTPYATPNVFAGVPQAGFAFAPPFTPQQAQAWGISRPQTIQ